MAGSKLGISVERAVELAGDASAAERVRVGRAVALATVCTLLGVRSTLRSLAGQGPGAESSVAKLLGVRSRQESSELVVELHGDRVVLGGADVEERRARDADDAVPVDRGRYDADPAQRRRRADPRPAAVGNPAANGRVSWS